MTRKRESINVSQGVQDRTSLNLAVPQFAPSKFVLIFNDKNCAVPPGSTARNPLARLSVKQSAKWFFRLQIVRCEIQQARKSCTIKEAGPGRHTPNTMMRKTALLALVGSAAAFAPSAAPSLRSTNAASCMQMQADGVSRRDLLSGLAGAAVVAAPAIANADTEYPNVPFLGGSDLVDVNNANIRVYTRCVFQPPAFPPCSSLLATLRGRACSACGVHSCLPPRAGSLALVCRLDWSSWWAACAHTGSPACTPPSLASS
jgi:hypothetical protein